MRVVLISRTSPEGPSRQEFPDATEVKFDGKVDVGGVYVFADNLYVELYGEGWKAYRKPNSYATFPSRTIEIQSRR